MAIWKFLHIVAMFAAVSLFVGQGVLSAAIMRTEDVRTIRRVLAAEARFGPVAVIMFVLGIAFGFITGAIGPFDLTAPWLLIAYGLVVVILATGIGYHGPRGRRLQALANESPEGEPSATLRALIRAPSARVVAAIDPLLWLAVIYVMVVKPFG